MNELKSEDADKVVIAESKESNKVQIDQLKDRLQEGKFDKYHTFLKPERGTDHL